MARARTPVTVVAGGPRSGKSRLIAQLRVGCPAGERWAYLGNSPGNGLGNSPGNSAPTIPDALLEVPAAQRFGVIGGCACCLAGPVFRTTLVRLLRADRWDRLHIEVDPQGHPHLLTDQLRQPPFDQHLEVTQLLLTLSADAEPGGRWATSELLEWAGDFLLRTDRVEARDPCGIAAGLRAAAPWPRAELTEDSARAAAQSLPTLPGWLRFGLREPDGREGRADLWRRWPADVVFERRPLKSLLDALAHESGVAGFQALMRTPRAWYRWRFGRGGGPAPLDFDEGCRLSEEETAWRLDSRIVVWLAPGARHEVLLARIEELDRY